MKKLVSLLVVLAMVLSLTPAMPIAFAATNNTVTGGSGTVDDPWVLESLGTINGTFEDENGDEYYKYEVAESGTYTMDSFSTGCNVMVFIDVGFEWGQQVSDPGAGFYVEAGQVIYFNIFYSYGEVFDYSAEFSFVAGEGGGNDETVGTRENPEELVDGYVEVTTDGDGHFYTWTADQNTLFVLEMNSSNWNYCVLVERADGEVYEGDVHSSADDLVIHSEIVEVFEGDVVSLFVSTADHSNGKVAFNAYPTMGNEEFPVDPYLVVAGATKSVNILLPVTSIPIYFLSPMSSGMALTVNGEDFGVQQYEPFELLNEGEAPAVYTLVYTYLPGTSDNPVQVDPADGNYTADVVENQFYYFSYLATKPGTLTVTVADNYDGAWYYYMHGSIDGATSKSTDAEPVKTQTVEVNEGDIVKLRVKVSSAWDNKESAQIPVTFTFVEAAEQEIVTGTLDLGANELAAGGQGEYEKSVYTFTAPAEGTYYFTVRAYYVYGYSDTSDTYTLTSDYTKLRFGDTFLTDSYTYSQDLAAGETINVKLISVDGDAYYVTLDISDEGFYVAQDGDREKPVEVNPDELPSSIDVPAQGEVWAKLAIADQGGVAPLSSIDDYVGGNLQFAGENIVVYVVTYDSYETQAFVYEEFTAVDGVVTVPVTYDLCSGNSVLQICNNGSAAATVEVSTAYELGHVMNPDALNVPGETVKELEENGNYSYGWTATADGKLTITVSGEYWAFTVNGEYYSAIYESSDTVEMILEEGAEVVITIQTDGGYDYETWQPIAPASTLTITTVFEAGVTCEHETTEITFAETPDWSYIFYKVCAQCNVTLATYDTEVMAEWNDDYTGATATVTVPAGATVGYFAMSMPGMEVTIADETGAYVDTVVAENCMDAVGVFELTNSTDADQTYTLSFAFPAGHVANPEQITELGGEVSLDVDYYGQGGYYYTYIAPGDGSITVYAYTENGYTADIMLYNNTTDEMLTLLEDGVDNYGLELTMDVSAGDEITIVIYMAYDEDLGYAPADTVSWYGYFSAVQGSLDNPIYLESTENVVENEGTLYYQGYFSGTTLTVTGEGDFNVIYNDETIAAVDGVVSFPVISANPRMPVVFAIEGTGTYTVKFVYPVGTQMNPELIENLVGGSVSVVENSDGYYYTFIAPADGTITAWIADITEGTEGNIILYNLTAYQMLTIEADAVDGVLTMNVTEGDEIQITVNTMYDYENWMSPAADITWVATFVGETADILPGDVNGDGKISTTDARLIMQYQLNIIDETGLNLSAADVNADGKVSTTDARLIMQLTLGLITEFPKKEED